jgi:hypothetical protein
MSPNTRKIGNDAVSPIGFGLMALSAFYGAVENDEERFKVCAFFLIIYFRLFLNSITLRYWTQHSKKAARSGIQLISMAITRT